MRKIDLADGHTLSVFASIYELTAERYNEFQCYMAQASEIGSDVNSVEQHFARLGDFIGHERTAEALDELALLHYNFNFIRERFNPLQLGFGLLVAKVDNEPYADFTEDGLTALIHQLSGYGLTQGQIEEAVDAAKKKVQDELAELFPARFDQGAAQSNYQQQQLRRFLALCDFVLTQDTQHLVTIAQIDDWLFDLSRPSMFDTGHPDNVLTHKRRSFGQLCAALAEQGFVSPAQMTLYALHSAVEHLSSKQKAGRSIPMGSSE
jgi:hypothetical protein